MLSRRALTYIGGTLLAGVALAWMLPPTKPIGGPTVTQVARGPSPQRETVAPPPDIPAPAPAALPPVAEPAAPEPPPVRADRSDPALRADDRDERVAREMPPAYFEDPRRSFRLGYRLAERGEIEDPRDCAQLESAAQHDGCLSYFRDSEEPEDGWGDGPDGPDR